MEKKIKLLRITHNGNLQGFINPMFIIAIKEEKKWEWEMHPGKSSEWRNTGGSIITTSGAMTMTFHSDLSPDELAELIS